MLFSSLGSITTGDSEATCATSLLSSYNSVTITDSTGSTTCSSTEMDGCADRTEMRYTYDASCGSTLKFSSQFNCNLFYAVSLFINFIFSLLCFLYSSATTFDHININVSANTLGFIVYEYYYSRWILDMYEECFQWWLHVSFGLEQRFISHRLHNIYLLIRSQLPICLPCEYHPRHNYDGRRIHLDEIGI